LKEGNYFLPTLLTGVRNKMRVAQEEIFGPVLVVIPFKDEEEALAQAIAASLGADAVTDPDIDLRDEDAMIAAALAASLEDY